MEPVRLEERCCLVTGAGVRVGRSIALELGARGARVAVHYNASRTGAVRVVEELRAAGANAEIFQADLTDPAAAPRLIREVNDWNPLHALVNSAAIMLRTPVHEVTLEQWDRMFAINLRAPFFLSRAAAGVMPDGSAIVNIADLAAFETWPNYIPHSITKAGVVQMTRALGRSLAPGIRVNAVAPGAVLLPEDCDEASAQRMADSTPLQRIGTPEDVANAVCYLLEAPFVTGEVLIVDGGRHVRR